jgi:aminoglycoside phosphotransferase (APT) family kinase protein
MINMSDQQQLLEQYLRTKLSDRTALALTRLDKLADGWESDNYLITVESGEVPRTRTNWVWRIYSGVNNRAKAAREFNSLKRLLEAGYPVPQVFLLETEHSPVGRPFIIMEYIQGEMMWDLFDNAAAVREDQLIELFCQLFVQLHGLDWRQFDDSLPGDDPLFWIDRWLEGARQELQRFPDVEAAPFLEWVAGRREDYACSRPAPAHRDFHPGNILIGADGRPWVIDWTAFEVTDPRFDLAWTLVLTYAHGKPGLRDQILQGYQRQAGRPVEQIEVFEAIACARRLLGLTVSLTRGAQHVGMNAQAMEAMRASMEAHRRVYRLFIKHTDLRIKAFDNLFGEQGLERSPGSPVC